MLKIVRKFVDPEYEAKQCNKRTRLESNLFHCKPLRYINIELEYFISPSGIYLSYMKYKIFH